MFKDKYDLGLGLYVDTTDGIVKFFGNPNRYWVLKSNDDDDYSDDANSITFGIQKEWKYDDESIFKNLIRIKLSEQI